MQVVPWEDSGEFDLGKRKREVDKVLIRQIWDSGWKGKWKKKSATKKLLVLQGRESTGILLIVGGVIILTHTFKLYDSEIKTLDFRTDSIKFPFHFSKIMLGTLVKLSY